MSSSNANSIRLDATAASLGAMLVSSKLNESTVNDPFTYNL